MHCKLTCDGTLTSQIHLYAGNRHHELIFVRASHVLAAPPEVVVVGNLEQIGHQVVTLDDEILYDGIHHRIGVLNSWYGNICHTLEKTRKDDRA